MPANSCVLIADDHEVFRHGLAQLARGRLKFSRVVEAASFPEALEQLAEKDVKLVIIDLAMPGLRRPAELARVRRLRPDVRLIVLSGSEERAHILEALAAGAHGYIVKSTSAASLAGHIRTVMAGTIYVPPSIAELPAEGTDGEAGLGPGGSDAAGATVGAVDPGATKVGLTARQVAVLRLIVDGRSNKEIAGELRIAEGTVKMHVTSVLRAIGARNRAQAAAIGRQMLG